MKKLMIVVPHLRTGGGQKLAIDEAIGFQNNPNYEVVILSLYAKEDNIFTKEAEKNNIRVIYLDKGTKKSIGIMSTIKNVIKKEKPNVVHTHLLALPYVVWAALGTKKDIAYYHTVHNVAEREGAGMMGMFERFAYKFAGFTPIAISDYCCDTIVSYYGLERKNIPIVYNGIDTKRFVCTVPYENRNNDRIRFISTGRMQPVKRHTLMVEAFAEATTGREDVELIFLGDGELREQVEAKISELGVSNKVVLKGVVSNVEEELNAAHVYLMCSEHEGLPLSVLEAMSSGLPVVATKAGGTIDVVDSGNGILCDVDHKEQIVDAIKKMLEFPELRKKMAFDSLEKSTKYDISCCVAGYAQIFDK